MGHSASLPQAGRAGEHCVTRLAIAGPVRVGLVRGHPAPTHQNAMFDARAGGPSRRSNRPRQDGFPLLAVAIW